MIAEEAIKSDFEERVVQISRVSKKTKGGNSIGFSALVVVGDRKGKVGVGLGKAPDVISAIRKGVKKAKKKMITIPMDGTTIPFAITTKKGAGKVMLKPAPKGSGVIAGGPVRSVVEVAGVRDISAKILGSQNQASSVYATFAALQQIAHIVNLKGITLKSIAEVEAEEAAKFKAKQEAAHKKSEAEAKSKSNSKTTSKPSSESISKSKSNSSAKKSSSKPTKKSSLIKK